MFAQRLWQGQDAQPHLTCPSKTAAQPTAMRVRLITLGVPSCRVDDIELTDLPSQKARFALLIYLALERNVSRDQAATMFWA